MDIDRTLQWVEPSIVPGFEAPPYDEEHARATRAAAGRSADDHARFLGRWNGCYALGGALHLFGARPEPPNQSLDVWNRPDGWRQSFGLLVDGLWCFAETAFGDQFAYREGKVVRLRVLDARVEPMASGFCEWIEAAFLEPSRWVSLELFDACVKLHGPLPFGGHFGVAPTHGAGAPVSPEAVEVMPSRDNMELRAATAIHSSTPTRPSFRRR